MLAMSAMIARDMASNLMVFADCLGPILYLRMNCHVHPLADTGNSLKTISCSEVRVD